ncbi:MAG TPA: type IV toxin-antitoxin system AbiEi family antitoxin [Acidimicrobiales bacterium]|nr:type IV toxin-antitoxin system AbiEi family antitoxin [Acidimicrobiales bacterium]
MTVTKRGHSAVAAPGGIAGATRESLAQLHRAFHGPFTVADAAGVLGVPAPEARRLLAHLARKRWLSRVRRGLYLAVPLDAARPGEWSEDPWLIAVKAFEPCYIGGWSAAEHWGLTEQLFRDVVVVTSRDTRQRRHVLQEMPYLVTRRRPSALQFGLRTVWRGQSKVPVSDPSRTLVDVLDDPSIGGGMRHVSAVISEYLASEHRNDELLVEYGDRLGNRSVFKRLGWVLEVRGFKGPLLEACAERLSAGLVKLDPTVATAGTIVRRWGLRANVALDERGDGW